MNSKQKLEKLTSGGSVSKSELKKIEREAVLDVNKNVDYQQELLNDIGRDLTSAHNNLNSIVTEVKGQTDTIYRIKDGVRDVETSNTRTNKNINIMLRRNFCIKLLMHIVAILLFLSILAIIGYKLFR